MHASQRGGLISFKRNRYSVPASFANRPVSLRIYPDRLVVAAVGNILCEHARVIQRSPHLPPKTIYDWRHYLAIVQRKPGALCNDAPFVELPPASRQLQDHMAHANLAVIASLSAMQASPAGQWMVEVLALVLHHDEQAVLTAVELALTEGVPTKTHVLNLLHRLVDGKVVGGHRRRQIHRRGHKYRSRQNQRRLIRSRHPNSSIAPEVDCISKGKARVRYELGCKVSAATTLDEGFVTGHTQLCGRPLSRPHPEDRAGTGINSDRPAPRSGHR
jgi:hypothetical protein